MKPCDVCLLLDGDNTPKEGAYCGKCKAFICKDCNRAWVRRGQAFFLSRAKKAKAP